SIAGDVKPFSMVQGLDATFMGAMFIGYHARAAKFGVMSHSMIQPVRNIFVNEHAIGEMGLNAYVAGYYGVPLLLVSGDDQACKESNEIHTYIHTDAVKETKTRYAVKSITT